MVAAEEAALIAETGKQQRCKQQRSSTDRRNMGGAQMEAERSLTDRRNRGAAQIEAERSSTDRINRGAAQMETAEGQHR
jgi:hypothetical protein